MWCWSFVDGTGIEFGSELLLLSVGIGGGGIVGSGRDGIPIGFGVVGLLFMIMLLLLLLIPLAANPFIIGGGCGGPPPARLLTLLFRSLVNPSISCWMTDSSSTSRSSTRLSIFSPISSMMALELAPLGCTSLRKANRLSRSTDSLLC